MPDFDQLLTVQAKLRTKAPGQSVKVVIEGKETLWLWYETEHGFSSETDVLRRYPGPMSPYPPKPPPGAYVRWGTDEEIAACHQWAREWIAGLPVISITDLMA